MQKETVDRFRNERKDVKGNPWTPSLDFLAMVAEVFGDEKAAQPICDIGHEF
ncbi:MAG TPA: hypothetical protein VI895_13120 [Bdellovibrionota bacterium]|nr:hypothetical protein [Bdellovibrionota bacterium]